MKKKPSKAATPRKNRVLIIDDHVMVREGVAQIIEQAEDLSVCCTASTANEGLEKMQKLKPDLVLVDITLPGKNGIEFIKEARAIQPDLRILVMSMHDESLYADRVLRAGGRGYIRKQEGGDKLIEAMRQVLRGEIAVSEKITRHLLEKFAKKSPNTCWRNFRPGHDGFAAGRIERSGAGSFPADRRGEDDEGNWRRFAPQPKNDRSASLAHSRKAQGSERRRTRRLRRALERNPGRNLNRCVD